MKSEVTRLLEASLKSLLSDRLDKSEILTDTQIFGYCYVSILELPLAKTVL